jgi:hypothetical protein
LIDYLHKCRVGLLQVCCGDASVSNRRSVASVTVPLYARGRLRDEFRCV